jgi:hypothetical protein
MTKYFGVRRNMRNLGEICVAAHISQQIIRQRRLLPTSGEKCPAEYAIKLRWRDGPL